VKRDEEERRGGGKRRSSEWWGGEKLLGHIQRESRKGTEERLQIRKVWTTGLRRVSKERKRKMRDEEGPSRQKRRSQRHWGDVLAGQDLGGQLVHQGKQHTIVTQAQGRHTEKRKERYGGGKRRS